MTLRFIIGRYSYFRAPNVVFPSGWSDPENIVENYDRMLHRSLDKIFREHCLTGSCQVNEFLRSSQMKSIIKPILEQEPILKKHFSKEEFGKLSLLWITVLGNYEKSAELLVRAGADVNEPFGRPHPGVVNEKWNVLYVLLQMDPSPENERLIRLVVDHGANLQARDSAGLTVLHYVVWTRRVQITNMLLEKGADVNLADNLGVTPMFMIMSGKTSLNFSITDNNPIDNELVLLLINHGANLEACDYMGRTVLHYATKLGRVQIIETLLEKGADVNAADFKSMTPLHYAVSNLLSNANEMVLLLLKYGADLEAQDNNKQTVLRYAVRSCQVQLTKMLLERGANVNASDDDGITPLFEAAGKCQANQLVPLLIKHGANLQARNYDGKTVLHFAVLACQVQVTEMLLEKGTDVNAADNRGMTPLLIALSSMSANELTPLLMKHGADVLATDCKGMNALHHLSTSRQEVVELARFLIEKGVSLDDRASYELYQPIHLAAQLGSNKLVELFLDHGAKMNAPTKKRESPLYLAAQSGKCSVVEILLERGANIGLKTIQGRTPLHVACQFDCNELNVVRLLLSAGADVLEEDNEGQTPLALITSLVDKAELLGQSWLLVEVLALRKALQPSIELKDESLIEQNQKLHDYYRKCNQEIDKMKSARLTESCTVFQLVTKRRHQIAALMRNPDFETQFRLHDINDNSLYAIHIRVAFERAKKYYHAQLKQENVINEAVYYILPDLVVKKVVDYVLNCCGNLK